MRFANLLILGPASIVTLIYMDIWITEKEARRSIDVLMREYLHAEYRIEAIGLWEPEFLFGDPSFSWKIDLLGGRIMGELFNSGNFGAGDRDDFEYYTKLRIPDDFSIDEIDNISGYYLARAGITLGEGTICPRINCGIEILSGEGNAYIYIAAF